MSGTRYAVLQVPAVLNRLVPLPDEADGQRRFVLLEDVIGPRLDALFGGYRTTERVAFRVTRNSDLTIQENEVRSSLLSTIEETLRQRKWGAAVRLEISERADEDFLVSVAFGLGARARGSRRLQGPRPGRPDGAPGPVQARRLSRPQRAAVRAADARPSGQAQERLRRHPRPGLAGSSSLRVVRLGRPVHRAGFGRSAGPGDQDDPLPHGRGQPDHHGPGACRRKRKQVTALVELQARLDEENNIDKARMLQKAGVHVVYGIVGLKTHCKASLVVRRDHDGIRRYVHLATGNYNPTTARFYTDLSFFTCRPDFGEDASALFNLLTGYSQGNDWNKLIVAPSHLSSRLSALIEREIAHAEAGQPARIIAKMNSLVDPQIIALLYRASQAGVQIDLIIRGICCLRPGMPGVSENIRVISIVDKYLEHSRISYFQNGDEPEVFLASADWMPRNFRRRVEIMFPIEDPQLQRRFVDGILGVVLADNVKARELQPTEPTAASPPRSRASRASARRSSFRTWPSSFARPARSATGRLRRACEELVNPPSSSD